MPPRPMFFGPLLYFRTIPALEGLSSFLLGAIAQHAEEVFFPAGSFLLKPEQPQEAFFIVVEGRVSLPGPGGREDSLGPGEALGFLHLLARSESGFPARAAWDTVALRVDWDAHLDACERQFPILEAHMRFLARRCLEELHRIRSATPSPAKPGSTQVESIGGAPWVHAPEAPSPSWTTSEELLPPPGSPLSGASLELVLRLHSLHRSRVFPTASMDALAELTRHLREVRLEPGSVVWTAGDPSESFLLVTEGEMELEGMGGAEPEALAAGSVAGRLEALAGVPRERALRTQTSCVALEVGLDPLLDILEDHFTMAVEFTAGLARELMALQAQGGLRTPRVEIL